MLDLRRLARSPSRPMATDESHPGRQEPGDPARAPLGSWNRLYLLVIVLHIVVLALLWWLTATYNLSAGNG